VTQSCLGVVALQEYASQVTVDICLQRDITGVGSVSYPWPADDSLGRQILHSMQQGDWCPNVVACLKGFHFKSLGAFWLYANLRPPSVMDGHRKCTTGECRSLQVDEARYHTIHMSPACHCESLGPSYSSLADMVMKGALPLVTIGKNTISAVQEVTLHEKKETDKFVAISHVWADGHGNPKSNTLPVCILDKIQTLVNALPEHTSTNDTPFWMDTLCLPVLPPDLRKQALSKLNEPFKHAAAVLVLDSYLQSLDVEEMSLAEAMARITVSGWAKRMWTYAEGRLGSNIWFQFKDHSINLSDAVQQWFASASGPSTPVNKLFWDISAYYRATVIMGLRGFSSDYPMADIQSEMATRTTSRKSDEPLCLGALLDLDMSKLVEASEHERMQLVWSLQPYIPIGVLLAPLTNRLTSTGFRWAPSSLMGEYDFDDWHWSIDEHGVLTADGLVATMPAILFSEILSAGNATSRTGFWQNFFPEQQADYAEDHVSFERESWLQDGTGFWYECLVDGIGRWHQDLAHPDPLTDEVVMLFVTPDQFEESAPRDLQIPQKPFLGLLATYPRDRIGDDIVPAKVHKHIRIRPASAEQRRYLDEATLCCEHFLASYQDSSGDLVELNMSDLRGMAFDFLSREYSRMEILLRLRDDCERSRETVLSRWQMLQLCARDVEYFCRIGNSYMIRGPEKPISWCID
jgi:hypothetical protein